MIYPARANAVFLIYSFFFPPPVCRIRLSRYLDHRVRDGGGARAGAGHEEISTPAGHLPGQCAAHTVGLPHVRGNRHDTVLHLDMRTGSAQAPVSRHPASALCVCDLVGGGG